MALQFTCSCGKKLQVDPEHAGLEGKCPLCGRLIIIPRESEPFSPASETSQTTPESPSAFISDITNPPREIGGSTSLPENDDLEMDNSQVEQEDSPSVPSYRLYSPGDVGLAAFLGGFLAGCLVLASNFWNLKKYVSFWLTMVMGLVVTVPFAMVLVHGGELNKVGPVIAIFSVMVLYNLARIFQGNDFETHLKLGGEKASFWKMFGLAMVGLAAFLGLAFLVIVPSEMFITPGLGQRLALPTGDEIYYSRGITKGEADKLGQYLFEIQYIGQGHRATVCIAKEQDVVVVSFVLANQAWDNLIVRDDFRKIQKDLKQMVFPGMDLEIRLCDQTLTPQYTLKEKK